MSLGGIVIKMIAGRVGGRGRNRSVVSEKVSQDNFRFTPTLKGAENHNLSLLRYMNKD